MILPDNETSVDLLNNEAIAKTIVDLLRNRPEHPITVGVHGDWGAGKSSVLEMIEATLEEDDHVLCLKFNGWRFQGFEDAKIALIEGIVTGLIEKRPALTKAGLAIKDIYNRIDWLKVAKKAGGLALTAYTGVPAFGVEALIVSLERLVSDPSNISPEQIGSAISDAKGLLKPKNDAKNVPEEINAFRKAFDDLLKEAGIQQLIVLIDDLDRCLPDTAIETLEAVRLFVFTSKTAFVVAADEAMIEYAVRKHFPDLPETTGPQSYARNYLEKLIQVPFRIPSLGETETLIYVTLLLVGAEVGEDDPGFARLIAAARDRLKRPWKGGAIDSAMVKAALAENAAAAQSALMLSEQIGPILASGTRGNPRQIKRFLNSLLLRKASADARGFGDDVKLPVLAKLMLAERFLTRLFDQIATTAASSGNGTCADLAVLETPVADSTVQTMRSSDPDEPKSGTRTKSLARMEIGDQPESAVVTEWLSSEVIKSWARIAPPISNEDLRPYLFVTKDRKDYFGATSILGHLATVAEKLLGPKLAVQSMEKDVAKLAAPEAEQVFEAVRGRIIGGDTFDKEPAGAAGLEVLVKAHPALQGNLLDFLESLPRPRLGPWVCGGWDGVLKDPQMIERFDRLLETWTKDGGQFLRVAANGTLRMRRQGAVR